MKSLKPISSLETLLKRGCNRLIRNESRSNLESNRQYILKDSSSASLLRAVESNLSSRSQRNFLMSKQKMLNRVDLIRSARKEVFDL